MIDVQFTETIASALNGAITSLKESDEGLSQAAPDYVERICRRAAWQLLFDLDGQALLDLALSKISAEQTLMASQAA